MERLWTPWRSDYVTKGGDRSSCFLCDHLARPDDEEAALLLHKGERTLIVLNKYPYNTGHVIVAPHDHVPGLTELSAGDRAALMEETARVVAALGEAMHPEGFNIGMNLGTVAGAGAPDHVHLHVVPRWGGDTNFMPIVGDTKVLPETLDQTAAKLRPLLSEGP
jgi:ATP adenylyltransferase